MKTFFLSLALMCTINIFAQFSFNSNGTGIQSNTSLASGWYSTALGYDSTASGDNSVAIGNRTTANGVFSTALGSYTFAQGWGSIAMGTQTNVLGNYASAMGYSTIANDQYSLVIGVYNAPDESPNPESFSYQNTAFIIGNGGHDSEGNYIGEPYTASNAFEVLFDGTTTIAGDLNINSDARLKANIISLGATLSKLLQIDAKTYVMKKDASKKQKIGVLAQDIETVFPELVTESNNIKSVNYQGLVPVLINAIKEQNQTIETQQDAIESLEQRLQKLEAILLAKPN